MTALMIASQNGHVVVLDTLLKHGARVDFKKEVYPICKYIWMDRREFEESFSLVAFLHYLLNTLFFLMSYSFFPKCVYKFRVQSAISCP